MIIVHPPPGSHKDCDIVPDENMIEQVFRMLLDEGAVTDELVEELLKWRHSGFSASSSTPLEATEAIHHTKSQVRLGFFAHFRITA